MVKSSSKKFTITTENGNTSITVRISYTTFIFVNGTNNSFSPCNRNVPESNTTLKSLQKTFNILDSAHFKTSFSIESLPHDLLFLRDLIALVMSSGKKVYQVERFAHPRNVYCQNKTPDYHQHYSYLIF